MHVSESSHLKLIAGKKGKVQRKLTNKMRSYAEDKRVKQERLWYLAFCSGSERKKAKHDWGSWSLALYTESIFEGKNTARLCTKSHWQDAAPLSRPWFTSQAVADDCLEQERGTTRRGQKSGLRLIRWITLANAGGRGGDLDEGGEFSRQQICLQFCATE